MRFQKKLPLLLLIFVIILAGCHFPGQPWVLVEITNHADGEKVVLNQEVRILAQARSSQGIERVDLFVNDELESSDEPPMGTPREHLAELSFTPFTEGEVSISVQAVDRRGTISDPFAITLQVVLSSDELEADPTPTPTVSPEELALTQTAQASCFNSASFVEHVTIPVGTTVSANSNFTKIWRVNNNGTCDWTGYQLVHTSGDRMGAGSPRALPMVNAGSNADILVDMVAPPTPGTYTSVWRIHAGDGTPFGPELISTINVPEAPTNTPSPTATFTATPTLTPSPIPTNTPIPISVQQVTQQVILSPNSTETNTVTCPSGSVVVSGGYNHQPGIRVWRSNMNGNGWRVSATNTQPSARALIITATCMFNSGGSTSSATLSQDAQPNDFTQYVVNCPSGSVVTGGGWDFGSNADLSVYLSTTTGNSWQINVNNPTANTLPVTAYAICLSGVSGSTSQHENRENTVPPNDSASARQLCPSGRFITGGGFSIDRELLLYHTTMDENGWINHVANPTGEEKHLDTFAICYAP